MSPASRGRIQVRVIHSEPLLAAGVLHSLALEEGICAAVDGPQPWQEADVVVTDLPTGLRLAGQLVGPSQPRAPARLLVLAAHDREFEVRQAIASGVHGYLLASCDAGELVRGVRAVSLGERYLGAAVASRVAGSAGRERLTGREFDVLLQLGKGHCNKAIARLLDISLGTVKTHVKAILAKLGATSRAHAVSLAVARGLLHEGRTA